MLIRNGMKEKKWNDEALSYARVKEAVFYLESKVRAELLLHVSVLYRGTNLVLTFTEYIALPKNTVACMLSVYN